MKCKNCGQPVFDGEINLCEDCLGGIEQDNNDKRKGLQLVQSALGLDTWSPVTMTEEILRIKAENESLNEKIDILSEHIIQEDNKITKYERLIHEIYRHYTDVGYCRCKLCDYHKMEIEASGMIVLPTTKIFGGPNDG